MKRKILLLVLSILLVLSFGLFVGCAEDGEDGLSIKSATIIDGELILTLTDDSTINCGQVTPDIPQEPVETLSFALNKEGTGYSVMGRGTISSRKIVIPETYKGLPVTEIANNSFSMDYNIDEIIIPDSVTSIGSSAFSGCRSLTSVEISDSVESIGDYAFSGCTSLTTVTIGNSVTSIGSSAFSGCDSLQYNVYDNAKYLGNDNNPYLLLIQATDTNITTCTINENCKLIHSTAFYGCSMLNNLIMPDSVVYVGDRAFGGCNSLNNIEWSNNLKIISSSLFEEAFFDIFIIPDNIEEIQSYIFYYGHVKSLVISNNVKMIDSSAFYSRYDKALSKIYFIGSTDDYVYNYFMDESIKRYYDVIYIYSENMPTDTVNNYWRYVDGVPTPWIVG